MGAYGFLGLRSRDRLSQSPTLAGRDTAPQQHRMHAKCSQAENDCGSPPARRYLVGFGHLFSSPRGLIITVSGSWSSDWAARYIFTCFLWMSINIMNVLAVCGTVAGSETGQACWTEISAVSSSFRQLHEKTSSLPYSLTHYRLILARSKERHCRTLMQCHRMGRLASSITHTHTLSLSRASGRFTRIYRVPHVQQHPSQTRHRTDIRSDRIVSPHVMHDRRTANLFSLESAAGVLTTFASWARLSKPDCLRCEQRTCLIPETATKILYRPVEMTGGALYRGAHMPVCLLDGCCPPAEQGGAGPQLISPKKRPSKTARTKGGTSTLNHSSTSARFLRIISTGHRRPVPYFHVSLQRTGTETRRG